MSATAISKEVLDSHGMIGDINAHHAEVMKSGADALFNASRAGEILSKMKKKAPRGEWGPLVKRLDFSDRTAQLYMQLFKKLPAAISKSKDVGSNLTIRGAMRLIAEAKPKPQHAAGNSASGDTKGVTKTDSGEAPTPTSTANSETKTTQAVAGKADSVTDQQPVRTDGKITGGTSFNTEELEAAAAPKPPKNGAAVKPEFDDAACKALYVRLVKLLDDRWELVGGQVGHRTAATKRLNESFEAYQKWVKG